MSFKAKNKLFLLSEGQSIINIYKIIMYKIKKGQKVNEYEKIF
jgi:hypothetical protein